MVQKTVAGQMLAVAACCACMVCRAVPAEGWFTFVSWNVGHHAMGLEARPTIPPGQDELYLDMYKTFIGDARIVGVCEYSAEFTTNQPMNTAEVLFGDYGVKIEGTRRGAQSNSLFLKNCTLIESREREYPERSQRVYYQLARVMMDGREVCVVETHLDWDLGEADTLPRQEYRADQMRTIISDMADEKYVIIGGDFNISRHPDDTAVHASEFDVFAEAGYTLANKGQLITWPSWRAPAKESPIDNIIVKGFEMRDVKVRGHDKLSDHKLISCRLRFADAAMAAEMPEVTAISMTQADSREVTISYTLANAPAVVTVDIQTNVSGNAWASIGGENIQGLSGDVNRRIETSGAHEIRWHPDLSWPDHKVTGDNVRAVVTAWPMDNPPDYMVVDISPAAGTDEVEWYPNAESVPGGVTNNIRYRQTAILMRKIMAKGVTYTAGSFGEPTATPIREKIHPAELNGNFYIGVFEVTQAQWALIFTRKPWPSYFSATGDRAMRPVERVSYNEIRCSYTNEQALVQGGEWPDSPYEQSYLGLLRLKTGIDFDLPTEAQWEYACRAGNGDGYWGNGDPIRSNNVPGRYNGNGGSTSGESVTAEYGTAIAGSYAPNSWGLYDMHGNIQEWCIDYYREDISSLRGAVNTEPDASHSHTYRGGTFVGGYTNARSAYRSYDGAAISKNHIGFRLVCPVEFD